MTREVNVAGRWADRVRGVMISEAGSAVDRLNDCIDCCPPVPWGPPPELLDVEKAWQERQRGARWLRLADTVGWEWSAEPIVLSLDEEDATVLAAAIEAWASTDLESPAADQLAGFAELAEWTVDIARELRGGDDA